MYFVLIHNYGSDHSLSIAAILHAVTLTNCIRSFSLSIRGLEYTGLYASQTNEIHTSKYSPREPGMRW